MTLQPVLARRVVACYAAWPVGETTPQVIVSASLLHERHGFAYGDAMVVEAALLSGATTLLSETCRTGAGSGPDDPEPVFVLIRSSS